jgi:hypothetical protein
MFMRGACECREQLKYLQAVEVGQDDGVLVLSHQAMKSHVPVMARPAAAQSAISCRM